MTKYEFEGIIDKYHRPVISLIYRHVFDWELSRDLAQDVFLSLWEKNISKKSGKSFFTLIYRMAINKSIDYLRKNKMEILNNEPVSNYDPVDELEANDFNNLLKKCFNQLKPRQRSVYILSDIEGLSIKDIRRIMKTSSGNVRSNLHLARKNIQNILKIQYHLNEESFYEL